MVILEYIQIMKIQYIFKLCIKKIIGHLNLIEIVRYLDSKNVDSQFNFFSFSNGCSDNKSLYAKFHKNLLSKTHI